jgi:hypothetical protein
MTTRDAIILCLGAALGCGGKTLPIEQPPGSLGPDGGFVGADGAAVLQAGSKCQAWDPNLLQAFATEHPCETASQCISWAQQNLPDGYPVFGQCILSRCWIHLPDTTGTPSQLESVEIHCTPGVVGDAFCRAYFSQFVVGGGGAQARCVGGAAFDGCVADDSCAEGDAGSCGSVSGAGFNLCVSRGSVTTCEAPCAPTN